MSFVTGRHSEATGRAVGGVSRSPRTSRGTHREAARLPYSRLRATHSRALRRDPSLVCSAGQRPMTIPWNAHRTRSRHLADTVFLWTRSHSVRKGGRPEREQVGCNR